MSIAYLFFYTSFGSLALTEVAWLAQSLILFLRALSVENLQAFKDGHEIPNIITGQFQDMFATFGGAGSTLSLIIVMVLFCKKSTN